MVGGKLGPRALVWVTLLACTALLGARLPDETATPTFSRPVPSVNPHLPYLSCPIGLHAESNVHHWKLFFRDSGLWNVDLVLQTSGVDQEETGALTASLADERGTQSLTVPFLRSMDSEGSLGLSLQGGKVYDLALEWVASPGGRASAYYYRLGGSDRRLEVGWAEQRHYVERGGWAIHAAAGEEVLIELSTNELSERQTEGPATRVTMVMRHLGRFEVVPPTTYTTFPAIISAPASLGETLFISMRANGPFTLRKLAGADPGLYVLPCLPEGSDRELIAAWSVGLDNEGQASGPVPPGSSASNSDGSRFPIAYPVIAAVLAAATAVALAVARTRRTRRPMVMAINAAQDPYAPERAFNGNALPLTARELEVVALVANGLSNREIGDRLVISEGTAKRHVENILHRLGLESRTQVAAWAALRGLVQPEEHQVGG